MGTLQDLKHYLDECSEEDLDTKVICTTTLYPDKDSEVYVISVFGSSVSN